MCGSRANPVMMLGGGDTRLYQGDLKYTPLMAPYDSYKVSGSAFLVGEAVVYDKPGMTVIVDTGSTGVLLPWPVYKVRDACRGGRSGEGLSGS
jgi:hypothetical protein